MTEQFVIFLRGLFLLCPAIVIGLLIAAYVPSRVIGFSSLGILLLLIHLAGATLRWPWRRRL